MASGVAVADECMRVFEEIKMGHRWLYVIYRVSDDLRTIVVEEKGGHDKTYEDFVEKLKQAESKKQCRYAVFDVRFMQNDLAIERLAFFLWSPDTATIKQKMIYTSSKRALRNMMRGIHAEIQCCDETDLTMANILERICNKTSLLISPPCTHITLRKNNSFHHECTQQVWHDIVKIVLKQFFSFFTFIVIC